MTLRLQKFDNLPADNTQIVAIVLFGVRENEIGEIISTNFVGLSRF